MHKQLHHHLIIEDIDHGL